LIPILYPQYCLPRVAKIFKKYFLDLSETSDIVFCDSKCSQQDFINFIKSLGGKVASSSVIRLGCEIPTNQDSSIPQLMEQEFILFVSTIERRKNHDVLYKAYHNLLKKHNKNKIPKLVFVGRKAWGVSELLSDINLDPVTKDQILILSNISDEQLSWLYKKALFVCYPSFYEGWGLPISEALLHGKFVLASNTSSIPEIAGNLVEYVDPYSATEWESKLEYYFGNRQELVRREKLIQSEFEGDSWESCAQTIIIELQEMNSSLR
jgi:glycosyltransferase involved in cell wall biosynthesis